MTIQAFLTRLIFLCVLPLLLLAMVLAGIHIKTLQRNQDQEASEQTYNLTQAIDRDLTAHINALKTLAASPLLDDPSRLTEFYREALGFGEHFTGYIVLADLTSQMLINTRVPLGSKLPQLPVPNGFAAAPYVLRTGKPAVGDMFIGPIAHEPLVAVAVPVKREEQTRALLLSIIETREYQELLDSLALPYGYSVTLHDSKGDVIAHRSESSQVNEKGRSISGKRFDAVSAVSHWSVVLEVPDQVYLKPLFLAGGVLAVVIVLAALISFFGGRLVSRRLVRSIKSLTGMVPPGSHLMRIAEIEDVRTLLEKSDEARESSLEELRQNEARYHTLFDCVPDGILIADNESHYLDANPMMCRMLGYTLDELIGLQAADIVSPDEVEHIQPALDQIRSSAGYFREWKFKRKDGSFFSADVSVTTMPDNTLLAMVRDITKRKQAEEALRENEARYRNLFEAANVGKSLTLPTGRISVNKAFCDMLGYEKEEMQSKTWQELTPPEDVERIQNEVLAPLLNGTNKAVRFEKRYIHKNGSQVWADVSVTLQRDPEGKPLYFITTVVDITERKQAEAILQESEKRYRLLFEENPQAMWVYDLETLRFLAVNNAAVANYGYSREEFLSMTIKDIRPPEDIPRLLENVARVGNGLDQAGAWNHIRKDGTIIEVEIVSHTLIYNQRRAEMVLAQDITERRMAERQAAHLEGQLRQAQKMEAVGRLAGGVAHDYNNMLTVIIGNTEIALEKTNPSDPVHADLKDVLDAAIRSTEITRQLLAFARSQTVEPQVLALNKTVGGVLKMLRRLIGEDIDLEWHPKDDLWSVYIDPTQIDQILANLCVNARDAIADVGKITIETNNATFDEAYCEEHLGFHPGEFVLLAVSDDGCGMEKETVNCIFEPFFTTKALGRGTGLGLSTVYGIIKQNQGFINVYSEPGQGTTFKVYLPRHPGEAEEVRTTSSAESPVARGETLLLVEDEDTILQLGKRVLENLGYKVLTADTPSDAINLAQEWEEDIHLLITDVVMPEMNGRELSERLQAIQPGIKTLFMSGYTANVIAHHGILKKGVNFVPKPFSRQLLAMRVRQALEG